MSAECARAAAWSLPSKRSGRSPAATRTWFMALRIPLSEARENWAAELPETTQSATKTAAHSAATCVGERIGGHSEGSIGRSASPKRGIWGEKLGLSASFEQTQLRPKRVLLPEAGRVRATLRAREKRRGSPRAAPASLR